MRGDAVTETVISAHDLQPLPVPAAAIVSIQCMSALAFRGKYTATGVTYGRGSTSHVVGMQDVATGRVYAVKYYTSGCAYCRRPTAVRPCVYCTINNKTAWDQDRFWHNRLATLGCDDVTMPLIHSIVVDNRYYNHVRSAQGVDLPGRVPLEADAGAGSASGPGSDGEGVLAAIA